LRGRQSRGTRDRNDILWSPVTEGFTSISNKFILGNLLNLRAIVTYHIGENSFIPNLIQEAVSNNVIARGMRRKLERIAIVSIFNNDRKLILLAIKE
jgi:hypothetical protein